MRHLMTITRKRADFEVSKTVCVMSGVHNTIHNTKTRNKKSLWYNDFLNFGDNLQKIRLLYIATYQKIPINKGDFDA